MTHPPACVPDTDLQQRKEMLVNYLQTVLRPDDIRLQTLIADLRDDLRQHALARLRAQTPRHINHDDVDDVAIAPISNMPFTAAKR